MTTRPSCLTRTSIDRPFLNSKICSKIFRRNSFLSFIGYRCTFMPTEPSYITKRPTSSLNNSSTAPSVIGMMLTLIIIITLVVITIVLIVVGGIIITSTTISTAFIAMAVIILTPIIEVRITLTAFSKCGFVDMFIPGVIIRGVLIVELIRPIPIELGTVGVAKTSGPTVKPVLRMIPDRTVAFCSLPLLLGGLIVILLRRKGLIVILLIRIIFFF